MVVSPDGPPCQCGKRGCLQALSSGTALTRRARQRVRGGNAESVLSKVPTDALTGRMVGEAALAGDPVAGELVEEAAWWIGLALANAGHLIDPERIIIGGGVADLGELLLEPIRASWREHIFGPATGTPIVRAELGYDAGVIGAAAVVMDGAGARAEP